LVLDKIRRRFPWLELIWSDGGYNARQVEAAVAKVPVLRMEIVKRSNDMNGFVKDGPIHIDTTSRPAISIPR
jgi:hypothetical protein